MNPEDRLFEDLASRTWETPLGMLTDKQVAWVLAQLTDQQKRVAHLLGQRVTQREVGEILGIDQSVVSRHRKAIVRKLRKAQVCIK